MAAFQEECILTVFKGYDVDVINPSGGSEKVTLSLWDVDYTVNEGYERIRPLTYTETNVVLLCRLLWIYIEGVHRGDENIEAIWKSELKQYCPKVPIILVGTKYDFRDLSLTVRDKLTAFDEGVDLARKIGAVEYMECSAKTGKGVKELFERAVKVGYKHWRGQQQKKNAGSCQLM